MSTHPDIREQILAQIAEAMEGATGALDAVRRAQVRYPGTPSSVCLEAWSRLSAASTEAWWLSVENTIEGEIIRHALTLPHGSSS